MTDKTIDTKPLDVSELLPCAGCGKGMMHGGNIHFYEVETRQCIVDLANVQRMHGLEMMMGGAVGLARVFSPSNTVAHRLQPERKMFCAECAMTSGTPVAMLAESSE